jgi:hypothetical protein
LAVVATAALAVHPRPTVLCVGRHRYLCEHIARILDGFGVDVRTAVGLHEAAMVAASCKDILCAVLCDFDLLEPLTEEEWHAMPLLAPERLVITSLNRRHDELPPLAVRGAQRFLYLPLTTRETALAAIS